MLISVIVPVYNVESYLEKCINSILQNTYKNLEIILVDDGSTDNSGSICDKYKGIDSRISVIHKQNGGLSSARNKGLDIATGEYVLFIDSDDFIEERMIEHLAGAAEENNVQVIEGGMKKINVDGKVLHTFLPHYKYCNNRKEILDDFFINRNISIVACGKLYKAEIFKNNIRFMVGKNNEDNIFLMDLLEYVTTYVCIEYAEYNYLVRKESITNQEFNEKKLDGIYAMKYILERCETLWPAYVKYAHTLACRTYFQLFCNYNRTKKKEEKYGTIILDEFNKSRKFAKIEEMGLREKLEIKVFTYFPKLISSIHNKIKSTRKNR